MSAHNKRSRLSRRSTSYTLTQNAAEAEDLREAQRRMGINSRVGRTIVGALSNNATAAAAVSNDLYWDDNYVVEDTNYEAGMEQMNINDEESEVHQGDADSVRSYESIEDVEPAKSRPSNATNDIYAVSDTEDESDKYYGTRNFDIANILEERIRRCESFASDAAALDQPIAANSPYTLSQFCEIFEGLSSKCNMGLKYQNQMLAFLRTAIPGAHFPSRLSANGNNISDLSANLPPSQQLIEISACQNDCCVFTSPQQLHCPVCKSYRYCSSGSKVNAKSLFYRSLSGTIRVLLAHSIFVELLRYKYVKPAAHERYEYMDVMDGLNARRHMNAMHKRFTDKKKKSSDMSVVEINILISVFYDGVQLFRKKVVNYWPLFFTILNLPPTVRTRVGAGMFLLTAYNGQLDSAAEKFLFEDCLIAELQLLRKGTIFEVKGVRYFVQVRCIAHTWDTKALGKQLCCQEVASTVGCPLCLNMQGAFRFELSKVIYHGHRQALPMKHWCRTVGHSTQCCPPKNRDHFVKHKQYMEYLHSFTTKGSSAAPKEKEAVKIMLQMRQNLSKDDPGVPRGLRGNIRICDDTFDMAAFVEGIQPGRFYDSLVWYHFDKNCNLDEKSQRFHPLKLHNVLWFEHLDYRPKIEFSRRTHVDFVADGKQADEENRRSRTKKIKAVNGVKGSWSFAKLKYCNVASDVCFDYFHSVYGVCKHLISILKTGSALLKPAKMVESCVNNNTHYPFLHSRDEEDSNYPWRISNVRQTFLDSCINAIIVPTGYSDRYQIENVFSQTGLLRSKAVIMVFTVLIDYVNLFADIADGYKTFNSMFGFDVRALSASQFSSTDITEVGEKILETVSTLEGVYGNSECKFVAHELVHIADHIRNMGPVSGFSTFSGERALKSVKDMNKTGGQSFDKGLMKRYV